MKYLTDLHVYGGVLLAAFGVGFALGWSWALFVVGGSLFYLGAIWDGK